MGKHVVVRLAIADRFLFYPTDMTESSQLQRTSIPTQAGLDKEMRVLVRNPTAKPMPKPMDLMALDLTKALKIFEATANRRNASRETFEKLYILHITHIMNMI